ncbi:MFS transporter [Planctomicrobium piriforme]|uniref:Predicted arabinose efflux permease, MFS family n=1 Tax=Planctomicrobium piriforme TaxID=1576369 RepID=A0A1I3MGQ9_9PLAN|nr:MFS transporter [Planctomicrobium piriforme]SFI96168.1 Predicted arabinose efflux permease, MFS family [Planctomicrobium piriforme]
MSSLTSPDSKSTSQRALDGTAFFLADVADGLGPFLAIYLVSSRHWTSGEAGQAMAMMLLASVVAQPFMGAWIDRTHHKRLAVSVAAIIVAISSVVMYLVPSRPLILGTQILTGVVTTVFPPALAAISLGLVGRRRLPARAGRNEACFHAGNVTAAGMAAITGWFWGSGGVFFSMATMAVLSATAVLFIREKDIDHDLARGADAADGSHHVSPLSDLFRDPRILWFALAVVLFHFANAAMLPLLGQKVSAERPEIASSMMGICIVVAQLTMVPVTILASRKAQTGRKRVMLLAFAVLPIRGLLYTVTTNPAFLIANQILDGVGAGIFGVVALLMMADLTKGTGRFNFAQGIVATGIGLGAALSNYLTGLMVDAAGFDAGFYGLSVVAVIACVVFACGVRETLQPDSESNKISAPSNPEPRVTQPVTV